MSNQKWKTTGNDDPWFQVALLWRAGQYRNGQHNTLATRGTTRRIKKHNHNHDARWPLRQSSTEQQESGDNSKETQDQLQYHLPLESQQTQSTNVINGSDEARKKLKEVWSFMYTKASTLTNYYKAAHKLWRKRTPYLRPQVEAKLLLKLKSHILKNKIQ